MNRPLTIVLFVAVVCSWAGEASAYRTLRDDPDVLAGAAQPYDTLQLWLVDDGMAADLDSAEAAVRRAASTWSAPSCTSLTVTFAGRRSTPAAPGDGVSSIELVYTGWSRRGFPADRGATTDVQIRRAGPTAEIAEADVYLNLEQFAFADDLPPALDWQGVITHEMGHALGLLHLCETQQAGVPECASLVGARGSTMYPLYTGSSQRGLSQDDIDGLCALYPATGCPQSCGVGMRCVLDACVSCGRDDCAPACPGSRCAEPACGVAGLCAEGACATRGPSAGTCVDPAARGAPCAAGADCQSGACLLIRDVGSCTIPCQSEVDCGGDERCAVVAGQAVCAPPSTSRCAVVAPGVAVARSSVEGLVLLVGVAAAVRRVKRRAR